MNAETPEPTDARSDDEYLLARAGQLLRAAGVCARRRWPHMPPSSSADAADFSDLFRRAGDLHYWRGRHRATPTTETRKRVIRATAALQNLLPPTA